VNLTALFTAFGLIFLLELPDKTAYTVVILSSRNRPLPVLFGAWLAFAVQSLVAVLVGQLLAGLPHEIIRWGTAAILLGFGLLLLFGNDGEAAPGQPPPEPGRVFVSAFALVFLAELGDATQIATAALAAGSPSRWSIFAGATLGLWTVGALAVAVGRHLGDRIPTKLLRRAAGGLLLAFALYVVLSTS
jgi:putative Ca2+/H+ antiporter (TMEM165/GDT1 family)